MIKPKTHIIFLNEQIEIVIVKLELFLVSRFCLAYGWFWNSRQFVEVPPSLEREHVQAVTMYFGK